MKKILKDRLNQILRGNAKEPAHDVSHMDGSPGDWSEELVT